QNAWANAQSVAHVYKEWRFHDVDMSSFIGDDGLADARWTLRSDAGGELYGWALDDMCFVGVLGPAPPGGDKLVAGGGCDGSVPAGDSCAKHGFYSGTLACTTGCSISTAGCGAASWV